MSMTEHRFQVPAMTSDDSGQAIQRELLKIDGVWGVDVQLASRTVIVRHDLIVDTSTMRRAINDAGYAIEG